MIFKKISILPPVGYDEVDDPEDIPELDDGRLKFKFFSGSNILNVPPGEILRLSYQNSGEKVVLVTATDRAPEGNFISTRDNTLLCCFELNPSSLTFKLVLKLFHKKEDRCHYKYMPKFLKFVFGLSAFKTLNLSKIRYLELLIKA
jgi:hypothetical protein